MTKEEIYKTIERDLEKWVYLVNAEEGNYGIYELRFELGEYDFLGIAEKYLVAFDLLNELLLQGLVILEEYESPEFKKRIREVDFLNYSKILNNPASWYPSGQPIYSIAITEKGVKYLRSMSEQDKKRLENRFLKHNPTSHNTN